MKTYNIDCIKMKDDIQAKLEASRKTMNDEVILRVILRSMEQVTFGLETP